MFIPFFIIWLALHKNKEHSWNKWGLNIGFITFGSMVVFMPFIICLFLYLAEPTQVTMLFTTPLGNVILVIAIGLDIGAFRIMQKLIDLDV